MKPKGANKVSTNKAWTDWKNQFRVIISKILSNSRVRLGQLGYPNTRHDVAEQTHLPHQVIVHAEQGKGNIAFIMLLIEFYNKKKAVNTKDLDAMYDFLQDFDNVPKGEEIVEEQK